MARPESPKFENKSTQFVLFGMAAFGSLLIFRKAKRSSVVLKPELEPDGSFSFREYPRKERFKDEVGEIIKRIRLVFNPERAVSESDAHRMTFTGPDREGLLGSSSLFPKDK